MLIFALCILSYLIGSFPTGVVLSRRKFGIDVREMGSGNIGATNITRNFGWSAGTLVFAADFFKGYLPLWFAQRYLGVDSWGISAMAVCLVLGHCFSLYLKFQGGKGVATTLGCLLAVSPIACAIAAILYVTLLLATRISAIGSLSGVLGATVYVLSFETDVAKKMLGLALSVIVLLRHRNNLERLFGAKRAAAFAFLLAAAPVFALPANTPFSHDVDATLTAAKREGKPMILSFNAQWCPPCNELEELVFTHPSFAAAAQAFRLLQVDVDTKGSWKLKSRYHVQGYPTVVFTDPTGAETLRFVGYRPLVQVLKMMELAQRLKAGGDYQTACRSTKTEDLERCARTCTERGEKDGAKRAYEKLRNALKPDQAAYHEARAFFVTNAENEDLKRDGLERLITELPASPLALGWAFDYLELAHDQAKTPLVDAVLKNVDTMMNSPLNDALGVTKTDLAQERAMVLEKLNRPADAKVAWKQAAAALEVVAKESHSPGRGFALERIACLESAGEIDAAKKLAEEYRHRFPAEFTFHYAVASIFFNQKQFNEALPVAKQALAHSYGDNKIRAATLLIKLYETVPDRQAAKTLFESVNKEMQPDPKLEIRTGRYLKKMREAYEKWNPA